MDERSVAQGRTRRAVILGGLSVAALAGGGALWLREDRPEAPRLTADDLDRAIALGEQYLVRAQRPAGDFVYEVDWKTGVESTSNEPVRQAGAAWGLGLAHLESAAPETSAALDRALAFWAGKTRESGGRRWPVLDDRQPGSLGTVCLIGLALVERLRSPGATPPEALDAHRAWLDATIAFVRSTRRAEGGFQDKFRATGDSFGPGNPYADGEALLLFAKAGVYLDRPDLADTAATWAALDHERNVVVPRRSNPDPDQTKGYYQWGSMSWYELARSGRAPEVHGAWLVELAHWMVDVHATLERTRNTAYAYEGLLSAYQWARDHGDAASAAKLERVAHRGLTKLLGWQVGHPRATALAGADPRFHGGIQNEAGVSTIRIDVVQHQTHAMAMARHAGLGAG